MRPYWQLTSALISAIHNPVPNYRSRRRAVGLGRDGPYSGRLRGLRRASGGFCFLVTLEM